MTTSKRKDYIAGLRELADLLDAKPDLPLPNTDEFSWYLFGGTVPDLATQKAEAARIVRLLGGTHDKQETQNLYRFKRRFHGIRTQVIVDRPAVCERVVIAAQVVTKQVPDPTVIVPLIDVTETVETVQWRCKPLFADEPATTEAVAS